jgi:N-methylhydantoinase A
MATILNAYVMPPVSRYVSRLDERLSANGIAAPLLLMKSSGGVMGVDAVNRTPIQTVLSGPAAGALGAADIALAAGFPNVVSIDIGGTSADVCLIRDGAPALTMRGHIGDWPLQTTMLDIVTIGSGGGSIARASGGGGLAVGPESAGAEPGPACYGRGGTEATVTDAHLVLGRMSGALLGDAFGLDADAAHAAVARLAVRLGLSVKAAAEGIIDVANNAMVGAIRLVSVERGLDPADFALLAFGGAGPLHGAQLARLLGMKTVIVPPNPGVLSAYGLLVADIRNDFSRTCLERPDYDLNRIAGAFADLEAKARGWLDAEGIAPAEQSTEWSLSLRYRHQGFELAVPMAQAHADPATIADAVAGFHALHERLYTFAQPDTPVEVVTLHVAAVGKLPQPARQGRIATSDSDPQILRRQIMHVDGRDHDCPVYERASLGPEKSISGPAVIAQHDSTTVVMPGQAAWVHPAGSILISQQ